MPEKPIQLVEGRFTFNRCLDDLHVECSGVEITRFYTNPDDAEWGAHTVEIHICRCTCHREGASS